jgi:hypothetical protein
MNGVNKYPLKSDVSGICKNKLKVNLRQFYMAQQGKGRVSGQGQRAKGRKKERSDAINNISQLFA